MTRLIRNRHKMTLNTATTIYDSRMRHRYPCVYDLERVARSAVDENGVTLYHEGVAPTENGYWVEAKDLQEKDV